MQNILHRLTVRKQLLATLLLSGLKIISREAGLIDCYLPLAEGTSPETIPSLLEAFKLQVVESMANLGYGCLILSATLTDDSHLHVSFSNDLMTYQGQKVAGQSGFGSRGNNKAIRAYLGVPTFPELAPTTSPVEQAPVEQMEQVSPVEQVSTEAVEQVPTPQDTYRLEKAKRAARKAAKGQ